jgi:hypothetical protein
MKTKEQHNAFLKALENTESWEEILEWIEKHVSLLFRCQPLLLCVPKPNVFWLAVQHSRTDEFNFEELLQSYPRNQFPALCQALRQQVKLMYEQCNGFSQTSLPFTLTNARTGFYAQVTQALDKYHAQSLEQLHSGADPIDALLLQKVPQNFTTSSALDMLPGDRRCNSRQVE